MSLEDQIKKEEAELLKLTEAEEKGEEVTEEVAQEAEEESVEEEEVEQEEESTEEEVEEEVKEENKKEEHPNSVAAQLRIALRHKKQLEEQLEQARQATVQNTPSIRQEQEVTKEETSIPQNELEARLFKLEKEKQEAELYTAAINEFNQLETDFSKETPDYEEASAYMINNMFKGVKYAYPNMTDSQATELVQKNVLSIASNAAKNGLNAAEVLYTMAYDKYGFKPQAQEQKPKVDKVKNLKATAKNKKRSASSLAGGGQLSTSNVTIEQADQMTLADFGRLSESEINDLIAQSA